MLPDRLRTLADLERLLATTTNYEERMPPADAARAFDLSRMRGLLAAAGNPQEGPRTFHVTGSKGKGRRSTNRLSSGTARCNNCRSTCASRWAYRLTRLLLKRALLGFTECNAKHREEAGQCGWFVRRRWGVTIGK